MLFYVCIGCLSNDWLDLIVQHFSLSVWRVPNVGVLLQRRRGSMQNRVDVVKAAVWRALSRVGTQVLPVRFCCDQSHRRRLVWTAEVEMFLFGKERRQAEDGGWLACEDMPSDDSILPFCRSSIPLGFPERGNWNRKTWVLFSRPELCTVVWFLHLKAAIDCLIRIQSVPFREHGIVLESCTERLILQQNMNSSVCSLYSHAGWS